MIDSTHGEDGVSIHSFRDIVQDVLNFASLLWTEYYAESQTTGKSLSMSMR